MLGELDWYMQQNESRLPTYAIHQNKIKMDKITKHKSSNQESPPQSHKPQILLIQLRSPLPYLH